MIARFRSSFAASTGYVAARPPVRVVDAGRVACSIKPSAPVSMTGGKRATRFGDNRGNGQKSA